MKSVSLWALIVLNVVIASALLAKVGRENTAVAQVGRASDYLVIPGQVIGTSNSVIYMLDMTNGFLGAMTYDPTRNKFDIMQPINLNRLFDLGAAAGNGNGNRNGRPPVGK
jgi:hypothetical protein